MTLGHVGVGLWLSYAMVPPPAPLAAADDAVMFIELIDSVESMVPVPGTQSVVAPPPDEPLPPPVAPAPLLRREPVTMQAIIEPRVAMPPAADANRERVSADRDPFHRPAPSTGFGRRNVPSLPDAIRPRIAGERAFDAPLPDHNSRDRSPRRLVETIGSFLGGGPNAPMEAPCGGRINGGASTADSFSPGWQKHYGCGDNKERAGYDGTVELPPGVAGDSGR